MTDLIALLATSYLLLRPYIKTLDRLLKHLTQILRHTWFKTASILTRVQLLISLMRVLFSM
ncbi:MAG: hypothetical protein QXZ63_07645 [Sulfolobales archaeon]